MIISRMRGEQAMRLPFGGLVDRLKPVTFTFDGKAMTGYAGDTLASALLANDVRVVGRSFKYHRPRGVFTDGPEEPNALVHLRTGARKEPNTRATMIELYHGLVATSQNAWPSVDFDIMEVNDLLSRFLVAGFYYKTFMGLPGWHFYEERIRKAAGMGAGQFEPDPDSYEAMNAHCDVLVIGSGAAGLSAARAAGRSGARVMVLEERERLGGKLLGERDRIDGAPAVDWVRRISAELADMPEVRILTRTTGFGYYDDNMIGAVERVADHLPVPPEHVVRQRLWRIRARRVILATGAIERPLVFGGNDRPGVMLAGAARSYLNRYAVRPGRRAVVFANNDDGYRTGLDLQAGGVEVTGIVDVRGTGHGIWRERAEAAGIEVHAGSAVLTTHGRSRMIGCDIAEIDALGRLAGAPRFLACDMVATSGGWTPSLHLHSHASGKADWDPAIAAFVPGATRQAHVSVGAAAGRFSLTACLSGGAKAGHEAASELGFAVGALAETPATDEPGTAPLKAVWRMPKHPHRKVKRFVDIQDDVTVEDIELGHREGFVSVEHLKRYTTLGMGTDQGKTSNINGHAILAEERGQEIPAVGTTTFRPPYTPVPMGVFGGRDVGSNVLPTRRSAMHDWHAEHGATFVQAGLWLRPQYYLKPDEPDIKRFMDEAITREVLAVRGAVGLVDVSTLGKIDIQGPDAAEFLNRVYANGFKTLPIGKARYGLMLREDGIVDDDGTTSRLGEHHYLMTTTTAHAGKVLADLEWYLQVVWPELDVHVCSVTEHWATMAVAGPKARDVLERVVDGIDVSNKALPFLGVVEGSVAGGVPARIFRISYSGELSYEVSVPADYGTHVWQALFDAGQDFGLLPYGMEAMGILRIEKGHVTHAELDGRTTLDDIGMGGFASTKKWFVGRGMLDKPAFTDPDRPKLIGLKPVDEKTRIRAGAILVEDPNHPLPAPKAGWVSSSAYLSPNLGHPIALGFCARGRDRVGERIWAVFPMRDEVIECEICAPCFFDPKGERLHA
jgi:sarcosine oxidase subunit alpha